MLENTEKTCGFEHEIVSYMYDELGAAERMQFETHLVDCTPCTDEFAAVSLSRFSVFEWQKEEFAPLATPEIVIPYATPQRIGEDSAVGVFAGLRGVWSIFTTPAMAAAAVAVFIGVGIVAVTMMRTGEIETVANRTVPFVNEIVAPQSPVLTPADNAPQIAKVESTSGKIVAEKVAVKTSARPSRQTAPQFEKRVANRTSPQPKQAPVQPVLTNVEDDDDRSLRLSDLFEDTVVGGGL